MLIRCHKNCLHDVLTHCMTLLAETKIKALNKFSQNFGLVRSFFYPRKSQDTNFSKKYEVICEKKT